MPSRIQDAYQNLLGNKRWRENFRLTPDPYFRGEDKRSEYEKMLEEEPSVVEDPRKARNRQRLQQIEGTGGDLTSPMAVPLVTIFKNQAARKLGNTEFLKRVNELYDNLKSRGHNEVAKNIRFAGIEFHNRYPRIAAHMDLNPELSTDKGFIARIMNPEGQVTKPILTEFGKPVIGRFRGNEGLEDAMRTFFHEGTHVAQSLGNKNADELYNNITEYLTRNEDPMGKLSAYMRNPFEQSAARAGERAVRDLSHRLGGYKGRAPAYPGSLSKHKSPNALEDLKRYALEPQSSDYRRAMAQANLRNVLTKRGTITLHELVNRVGTPADILAKLDELEAIRGLEPTRTGFPSKVPDPNFEEWKHMGKMVDEAAPDTSSMISRAGRANILKQALDTADPENYAFILHQSGKINKNDYYNLLGAIRESRRK